MLVQPGGEPSPCAVRPSTPRVPRGRAVFRGDAAGAVAAAVADHYGTAEAAHVERSRTLQRWYRHEGALVAAWVVECFASHPGSTTGDAFRTVLAGDTGQVLERVDLTADDAFTYRVFAEATGERRPFDGPTVDPTPNAAGVPNGSFPPFVLPSLVTVASLNHLADPWLPPGATDTRGNNVDAYADVNAPSGLSNGDFRATATAANTFDRTYDTSGEPLSSQAQQMAAITALFYTTNYLHDFWYDAGFTEAAANAQQDNYGRGGVAGDPLLAEAQDNANAGSRNNANMATPSDGMSPRMQVFLWSGDDERTLTLQPQNRTPPTGTAAFGAINFDTTAPLVLGVDGAGADPNDACTALANDVAGKIVLVNRGQCSFELKALNVQSAGGAGVIIANNQNAANPPQMPGDATINTPITIGVLSVTMAEGALIKQELAAGAVTATTHRRRGIELDGALDATIVAHEYGHYLHHRLSQCDSTSMCRAMSEGWGDLTALVLQSRAGDPPGGAYPFAVYATRGFSDDAAYFGIRRAPYSTDLAINGLSFRHMADGEPLPSNQPFLRFGANSEVHNAGEVWAAILWDAYQAVIERGPTFEEARGRMARYLVGGLLMSPPEASPIEVRDALLAVIRATDHGDHDAVIAAFARRGMGSCAVAPPRFSSTFAGIVESTQVAGRAQLGTAVLDDALATCDGDGILDNGERALLTVPVTNRGHAPLTDLRIALSTVTTGLSVVATAGDGAEARIASLAPDETVPVTFEVSYRGAGTPTLGVLAVAITSRDGCAVDAIPPITMRLDADDIPAALATDTFDAATSVWSPAGTAPGLWKHERKTALDGQWHGLDAGFPSDTSLVSPPLQADAQKPLVIAFSHRHDFESSPSADFDGGVIEVTTDGGATWVDVATLVPLSYGHTLTELGNNPLAGRPAFSGKNPQHPAMDQVTLAFGNALAGKTFQIRFRIGTDSNTGAEGWELDEVVFDGIVGTPFPAQGNDGTQCDAEPPPPSEDGGCCGTGPVRPGNAACALGVLAFLLRRRRRS
ncbi:MAG: M36 family metallopeptidase [Deltaproteobacteria bacterium]|nr:M36 family metallopeptidase [Deltaproteobacteria bacterium]